MRGVGSSRSAQGRVLRFLLMFWLAAHGKAQRLPEISAPIKAEPTRGAGLLIATSSPGVFLPSPALETDVAIRVTGIVARARVRQRFANPTGDCVEGIYVFPLPEGSAVDRLRMTIGDRTIEGEVREREEGKKVFEQAKSEGKKASLVEQERPNVFTASVAAIGPNEQIEIAIEYQETLVYDAGTFRLRFPLVVAPRYIPGTTAVAGSAGTGWATNTDSVPDAARITPAVLRPAEERHNPVRLRVDLAPGIRLRKLESSTHAVRTSAAGEALYTVTTTDESLCADRDFELHWEPDLPGGPRPSLQAETRDGEIFAMLVLMPPDASAVPEARLPRETIFIIDTSGSMYGASIGQARAALSAALERLQPEDRFNVIEFNSVFTRLFTESHRALPDAVAEARSWVGRLEARGGTEMLPALKAALEGSESGSEVRQVIFMTDGGVGNEEELFAYIRAHLGRSRLFTVGIGSAPNSHFMTKAAEFGRGTFTYVGSPAEVESKMGGLFRKLESPVLTDVRVQWDDAAAEAWPSRIPDLYAGEPLIVTARLSTPRGGATVSGQRAGVAWSERVAIDLSSGESGIDRLWARRKIAASMDRSSAGVDAAAIRREVVEVAVKHHLISSFTSLVAVDVTPTVGRDAVCPPRPIPVNLPAGWDYAHVFGEMPRTATPAALEILAAIVLAAAAAALRVLAGTRP